MTREPYIVEQRAAAFYLQLQGGYGRTEKSTKRCLLCAASVRFNVGRKGEVPKSGQSGTRQNPDLSYEKKNDCEDRQILRPRIVYAYRVPYSLSRWAVYMVPTTV